MLFANAQESGIWGVNTNPSSVNSATLGVNHSPSSVNLGVNGENSSQKSLNSSPSSINSSASGEGLGLMALNSSQNALDLGNIAVDSGANAKSLGIVAVNSNESGENLGGGNSAPSASSVNSAPSSSASSENIVSYELEAVDISAKAEYEEYSSGQAVSRETIEQTSGANADIPSVLKTLPNVKAPSNASSSNMPAELDPANISISGAIPQQNSYQVDGLEMNFDSDDSDSQGTRGSGGVFNNRNARLQGLNVDASLLDSVVVLDSNIPAQYGRFAGGVVQANIRKPRKDGWHGDFSFQTTNSSMTKQRMYEEGIEIDPSSGMYQDDFNKFIIRASLEGGITDTLSMLAAFSTARSSFTAPIFSQKRVGTLLGSSHTFSAEHLAAINENERRTQKRRNDNYYLKLFWEPSDKFNLEYSLAYMPSTNTYYSANTLDSRSKQIQGGWQTGLKALWSTDLGLWTNQLGYTRLTNLQRGDHPYSLPLDGPTTAQSNDDQWIFYGAGAPDADNTQDNFTFKSDFVFEPVSAWISTHTFRVGVDLGYQLSSFERLEEGLIYYLSFKFQQIKNLSAVTNPTCNGVDEFGAPSCDADHYLPVVGYFPKNKATVKTFNYSAFAEDDINFDLGNGGDINARIGVRFDGFLDTASSHYDTPLYNPDTYLFDKNLNKNKVAPRISLQYVAPWKSEWETALTFGANRYYARNLAGHRLKAMISGTRRTAYRCSPNEPFTPAVVGATGFNANTEQNAHIFYDCTNNKILETVSHANFAGNLQNAKDSRDPTKNILHLFSGDVAISPRFDGVDLPYDDELMGAWSQNFGGLFNTTLKYIHRDGKKQIMQRLVGSTAYWGNDGWTKSHIITLALKNIAPIKTGSIDHFYQASLEYIDTKRNYITYGYDISGSTTLDGKAVAWEDIRQIYKEPLTFKLSTTHIFNYGKMKLLWNNLFAAKGSYKRIIYTGVSNDEYRTHKFGGSFNWDMRLGLEAGGLYINVDVLNVLDSKKLIPIGAENGVILENINSNSMILAYQLGRQFWLQLGYKF